MLLLIFLIKRPAQSIHWVQIGFVRQPCCLVETYRFFFLWGKNVLSSPKPFHISCHETWLPCKTSEKQGRLSNTRGPYDALVVRLLASHKFGPDLFPARSHMWVEHVVGSRLCFECLSPGFQVSLLPSTKSNTPNSKTSYG